MASNSNLDDFRNRFSEFSKKSDNEINRALEEARFINSVNSLATLYIAAHLLIRYQEIAAGTLGATGAIKMDKVGPMQSTYTQLVKDGDIKADLAKTQYGVRALMLESRTPRSVIGAMVVA